VSSLCILNPTTSALTLAINDEQIGSLSPCAPRSSGYTPTLTSVDISKLGSYTLGVTFQQEPGACYRFSFLLPEGFPFGVEDVVAAVTRGVLLLTRGNGNGLTPNLVPITGELLSPTHPQVHYRRQHE
jgi:hypothetical protein